MTVLTRRGSGTPATTSSSGSWATATNAVDGAVGTNPATYAVWTSTGSGANCSIEVTGYDFASVVPSNVTLNSVTVYLRHFESNTSRIPTVMMQPYDGATAIGTNWQAISMSSAFTEQRAFPVTLAQLRSSTFKVRVTATRGAVTQSATFNVDQVDVVVDYTEPTTPVSTTISTSWDTETRITATRATSWNTLQQVAASVYGDNFNRADTTAPGLGSNWAEGTSWYISAGKVTKASDDSRARFVQDLGSPDNWAEVDVINLNSGGGNFNCVNARRSAASVDYYLGFIDPGSGEIKIGKVVSGSYSDVASGGVVGDADCKLRLECEGTALRLYRNDSLVVSTTNSDITTGNYAGLNSFNPTTGTLLFDNFRCGPLPYIAGATAASRTTTWNVEVEGPGLTPVSASRATSWSVRTSVTASRASTWDTERSVVVTRATTWAATAAVTASRATTWNVAGALISVQATRATTWGLRAQVIGARATTWNTRATTAAATRATTWVIRTTVTGTRTATWNVIVSVVATRTSNWVTLRSVTLNRATTWSTQGYVVATRATTWNVSGSLLFVQASRVTTWRANAVVTGVRVTTWNTRTAATATRATVWVVRAPVVAARVTTWSLGGAVVAVRASTWATLAGVTTDRSTSWSLWFLVVQAQTTSWTVFREITVERSTRWDLEGYVFVPLVQHYLTIRPTTAKMYYGSKPIKAIYRGKDKIWESV